MMAADDRNLAADGGNRVMGITAGSMNRWVMTADSRNLMKVTADDRYRIVLTADCLYRVTVVSASE